MEKTVSLVTNNINCERHTQYYNIVKKYFIVNGWNVCDELNADILIIAGCGFHNHMYEKILDVIDRTQRGGCKKIVLLGCAPKTHGFLIKNPLVEIIPFHEEEKLDTLIKANIKYADIEVINDFVLDKQSILERDSYYIKIAEGCLQRCNFCVIKKAKGYIKSTPQDKIIQEFKTAIKRGYKKIFLMAEDTFAYGFDKGDSIINLVNKLLDIEPNVTFYFGSLHCRWIEKYADDIVNICQKGKVKKLNIGLQHVNESLLKSMGRTVNFSKVYDTIKRIKEVNPNIYISIDVLIGFPGETDEQFNELVEFFKKDKCFDFISHYGYSDVVGAQSNKFDNKVDSTTIALRWNYLNKILADKSGYKNTFRKDQSLEKERTHYFI